VEASSQLSLVNRQRKHARMQASRLKAREERLGFTLFELRMTVAVFVLSDSVAQGTSVLQMEYETKRRRGRTSCAEARASASQALPSAPTPSKAASASSSTSVVTCPQAESLTDVGSTWYLRLPWEEIASVHRPATVFQTGIRGAAPTYLKEAAATSRVRDANAKGVAFTSLSAYEDYALRDKQEQGCDTSARSKRRWTQRFRRRWVLKLERPPQKPPISQEELSRKV